MKSFYITAARGGGQTPEFNQFSLSLLSTGSQCHATAPSSWSTVTGKDEKWARDVAQFLECFFTIQKALSSSSSPVDLAVVVCTWNPSTWELEAEVQDHPHLCKEFKSSLGYVSNKTDIKNTLLCY